MSEVHFDPRAELRADPRAAARAQSPVVELPAAPRPEGTRFPALLLLAAGGWVLLLCSLVVADGATWGRHLGDLSLVVFPALAALSCLRRGRSAASAEPVTWRLLSVAMLIWGAGGAVWTYSGFSGDGSYPFPSLADVGFLGYMVPMAAALLSVTAVARSIVSSVRVVLDGVLVAVALLFVSTATVLRSVAESGLGTPERLVLLAYPGSDLLLVSLVAAIAMRVTPDARKACVVLGAGLTCLAVMDGVYVTLQAQGEYRPGTVFDIGWATAFVLIAAAPHVGDLGLQSARRPTVAQRLTPYVFVTVASVVGAVRADTVLTSPLLLALGVALMLLLLIRQCLAVVDETRHLALLDSQVLTGTDSLRREREFLRAVVDNLEAGVVACDLEERITFCNEATATLHDDTRRRRVEDWHADLRDADGTTLLPHEDVPLFRALRGELVVEQEIVVAPPGGPPVRLTASGRALYDNAGERVGAVVAMHDVTALRQSYEVLAQRDLMDELTGLGNRRRYAEAMAALLAADRSVAVLLIDLDDFKDINDSLGHDAGDLYLIEVGRRIADAVPTMAAVCRLGGDEFVIVLPDAGQEAVEVFAEGLLSDIAEPACVAGFTLETTASIGIALRTTEPLNAEHLLKAADLAMYRAKSGGKARFLVFDRSLEREATRRLSLQSDLRKAVASGGLTLAYQPVVDLCDGRMTEVEALLRWIHPRRGTVSPGEFIPVAEESGLIVPIGSWVLRSACAQLLAWDAAGGDVGLGLAVNVSAVQLERFGLLTTLDECLATGVDPARLTLEITETALSVNSMTATATLEALRDRGVKLAIDDFGTGYSSLARLRSAQVGRVKIDRSFISDIENPDSDVPIVEATMAMARGLGFEIIAEGVETPAQLTYLRAADCPSAQGFLFSRPMPSATILQLMTGPTPWKHRFGEALPSGCTHATAGLVSGAPGSPEGGEVIDRP